MYKEEARPEAARHRIRVGTSGASGAIGGVTGRREAYNRPDE